MRSAAPPLAALLPLVLCVVVHRAHAAGRALPHDHHKRAYDTPPSLTTTSPRVLFVTAIYGPHERALREPVPQTLASTFIAFTDRVDLLNTSSSLWQVRYVPDPLAAADRAGIPRLAGVNALDVNRSGFNKAKLVKMQFHRLVDDFHAYTAAAWLDGSIRIATPDAAAIAQRLVDDGRNFAAFEHEHGGRLAREVDISHAFDKYATAYDGGVAQDILAQWRHYEQAGYRDHWWLAEYDAPLGIVHRPQYGVWITCFIVYAPHAPLTSPFLDMWWWHNVRWSTEDQVSFPFVAWSLRAYPFSLPAAGYVEGDWLLNTVYQKMNHTDAGR